MAPPSSAATGARLAQWRTFDRTGRPEDEPYYIAGIATFGQPPAIARKAGKTGHLAFQYQGGTGAYRRVTGDMTTAEEIIQQRKLAWRAAHPAYDLFWRMSIFQAVQAIRHPGRALPAKAVTLRYDSRSGFLEITLPSGRVVSYPWAELYEDEQFDSVSFTFLDASRGSAGKMYHELKGGGAFGGLLLENITQAFCRDVFVEGMLRLEAAGYCVVMHSHDDFVVEVPEDFGSLEEFVRLITTPPSWAPGLPVAAKARIADRFIEIPEPARIAAVVTDNVIDNAVEELREEAAEIASTEPAEELDGPEADLPEEEIESLPELPPFVPTLVEPTAALHACGQCHGSPDGSEQVSAYGDVWLHAGCQEAFIRARMAAEGIAWEAGPPSPAPEPAKSNGKGNDPELAAELHALLQPDPAPARGNGQDRDGYPHGEASAGSPVVDTYIYKAADGRMHTKVERTAAKQFPTYRWESGAWVAEWPKTVVPYRLPELLAAPADAIVLIVEGEGKADVAARYGYVATTNPGGAKQWQPELAQHFKGKQKVCIVEDHDTPGASTPR